MKFLSGSTFALGHITRESREQQPDDSKVLPSGKQESQHNLRQAEKQRLKTIATAIVGREVSGLTGLYCHFIYLAHNFILSRDEAADLGIKQDFLKPSLPSSRQLQDSIILSDHDGYPIIEKQLVVIDSNLSERALKSACPALWSYLQQGEASGIRDLYLVAKRTPWYRQEHRDPAPLLCMYMGRSGKSGNPFRFFWNQSRAIATNVYLLLYPVGPLKAAIAKNPTLLKGTLELLQSLEPRALVQEGRVYGGGLHKLEPAEFGHLDAKPFLDCLGLHLQPKLFA